MPYLTAGYPTFEDTLEMMRALSASGALALEVGIPFSDPIADGPDIQRGSEWALRHGVGAEQALALVARFRDHDPLPVVIMSYAQPILASGVERFTRAASQAGADGLLISDLPPEEAPEVWEQCDREGLPAGCRSCSPAAGASSTSWRAPESRGIPRASRARS